MRGAFINHYVLEERTAVDRLEVLWPGHMQRMAEDTVAIRFSETPVRCAVRIRQVTDPPSLRKLNLALLKASNQTEIERILTRIGEQAAR
jgi:hypothetical protein